MDDKVRESLNAAIVAAAGKADNADDIVALVGAAISMPDKLTWRDHVRAIKAACTAASTCGRSRMVYPRNRRGAGCADGAYLLRAAAGRSAG